LDGTDFCSLIIKIYIIRGVKLHGLLRCTTLKFSIEVLLFLHNLQKVYFWLN
jgi:hypothetical protein